jgi:very-short-patch-repair endonuclease
VGTDPNSTPATITMPPQVPLQKTQRARQLRREQTIYEKKLWDILRAHKMSGFHFRRQHPIGPYVTDFARIAAKLIIELDDNSHDDRIERDANRDFVLRECGWKTLRFPNVYARDCPDELWRQVEIQLKERLDGEN